MKGYYQLIDPTFEQYLQRGVYLAQCKTSKIAKTIAGNFNNVLASTDIMAACRRAPYNLRIVRDHRDESSQHFRDMVAREVRNLRAERLL